MKPCTQSTAPRRRRAGRQAHERREHAAVVVVRELELERFEPGQEAVSLPRRHGERVPSWRESAQWTCSLTSADGWSARERNAATTVNEVGALPRPTAILRSQRS